MIDPWDKIFYRITKGFSLVITIVLLPFLLPLYIFGLIFEKIENKL